MEGQGGVNLRAERGQGKVRSHGAQVAEGGGGRPVLARRSRDGKGGHLLGGRAGRVEQGWQIARGRRKLGGQARHNRRSAQGQGNSDNDADDERSATQGSGDRQGRENFISHALSQFS